MSPQLPASADRRVMRVAVIGGGISGLAAAHRLVELKQRDGIPVEITLFEASSRLGGVFGSEQIGDYLIERGADSFITNKPWALDLCRRLGMGERLISTNPRYRRSLILRNGKPVATPEGFNLLAPGKFWPMVTTPLLSWTGKLRVAAEAFLPRRREETDESLADFVRRRFGNEVLERIVQPLVGGIYTSNPETLSLSATLPRFPEMERQHGSVIRGLRRSNRAQQRTEQASGARYGLFVSPRDGMQDLLDTLTGKLHDQVDVRLQTNIRQVSRRPSGELVVTGEEAGNAVEDVFDRVILCLPAFVAARLLPAELDVAKLLQQIEYASSAIVVTGHRLDEIEHPLDAFGLVIPHRERRRILAVSFLSRKFDGRAPAGRVILRTFVGGAMQPEEFQCTDDEIRETVLRELRELLGVRGDPDFCVIARYERAMPQYTIGHQTRVAAIRERMTSYPELVLAGNFLEGVGVPDCVRHAEQAAESAWGSLAGRAD